MKPDLEVPVGHPLAFEVPVARLISIITVNSVRRSHFSGLHARALEVAPAGATGSLATSSCLWAHERPQGSGHHPGSNARALRRPAS